MHAPVNQEFRQAENISQVAHFGTPGES